jgi:hypothetical protein
MLLFNTENPFPDLLLNFLRELFITAFLLDQLTDFTINIINFKVGHAILQVLGINEAFFLIGFTIKYQVENSQAFVMVRLFEWGVG